MTDVYVILRLSDVRNLCRITLLTLFCLMAGQTAVYSQDMFFPEGCDFGTIHEKDGKAVREFTFRNDRRDTLVICDVTTGCRCITGEASFEKVPPGKTGTVRLTFDPAYRSGPFDYQVVLWYMDRMASQRVKVTGSVVPAKHPVEEDHPYYLGEGLYTSHKVLPLGSMEAGETKSIFFRYANGTDDVMHLTFEVEGCCARQIEMQRSLELAPDERGKLYVSLTMPEGYSGSHVNRIWPVVNGVRLENPLIVKVTTRKP